MRRPAFLAVRASLRTTKPVPPTPKICLCRSCAGPRSQNREQAYEKCILPLSERSSPSVRVSTAFSFDLGKTYLIRDTDENVWIAGLSPEEREL
jgi:hypothetical protein